MTQAQILQQTILYDFLCRMADSNPLEVYTDSELKRLEWIAIEENDGKKLDAIRREKNRREREQ
jgi:hypothetical protein